MRQTAYRPVQWLVMGLAVSVFIAGLLSPTDALAVEGEEAAGTEAVTEEHAEPGGPIEWQTDLAIWSLVSFLLLVAVLGYFAWGPLMQGLDARESRIRQDIADAEAARLNAEHMLAEHERRLSHVQDEVRGILDEARRDAEQARQNIVSDAQREADANRQRAINEIERAKSQAVDELFSIMATRVADATEHVLGRSVTDQDQNRLIEEALAQFPRNGNATARRAGS